MTQSLIDQALTFLNEHNELAFATCDNGRPRLRTFQIMRQDGATLFFATSPKKEVYKQLQTNHYVELMSLHDKVSVRCGGAVSFDVSDADRRWIYAHNPVLPRLYDNYEALAYFKLEIEYIDYYDLRPTPPILLHHNLIEGNVTGGFVGDRFGNYMA